MYMSPARHIAFLQTSSRPAFTTRLLSLLTTRQTASSRSAPPHAQRGRIPVRFASQPASKPDSGDVSHSPLMAVVDGADDSPALETGILDVLPSEVESIPVLGLPSHVAPEPAAAKHDGLTDSSHEDTEDLLGQNKDPKETNEDLSVPAQSLLGVPDSDIYGMPVDPIPPLPRWPSYPAPQITDQDLKDYIIPLYSRRWFINYFFKKGFLQSRTWHKSATLCRIFDFPTLEATVDFVTRVAKVSQVEDHYPKIAIEKNTVYVTSWSHSAFRDTSNASTKDMTERQRPGITLRDVRFAIIVEDTFSRHFLASGRGLQRKIEPTTTPQTPQTMAAIEKATQKDVAQQIAKGPAKRLGCRVCNGHHDSLYCPKRYTSRPPVGKACKYCGKQGHWSMNCPLPIRTRNHQLRYSKQTLHRLTSLHAKDPPSPCRKCGRNHWVSECMLNGRLVQPPLLSQFKKGGEQ